MMINYSLAFLCVESFVCVLQIKIKIYNSGDELIFAQVFVILSTQKEEEK